MTQEEIRKDIKQYLKDKLKLKWVYYGGEYHLVLQIDGEDITNVSFGEGY